jgi:phospholipid/cholesterol/gamma-HCH transport system substrate-binding protein
MESRINYILVGVFVLIFTAGLLYFVFWLGKYGDDSDYVYYKTYMKESVSGLNKEAAVKLLGVDVGIVQDVRIDPENSEQVELLLKIEEQTPIRTDMTATLKSYGLTGLTFIEISGGTNAAPLFNHDKGYIPVIEAGPSLISRVDDTVTELTDKLSKNLDSMSLLLNQENIENVSVAVANIRKFSDQVISFQERLNSLISKSEDMEESIINASERVSDASDGVKEIADTLDASFKRGDYNVRQIASKSLEKFDDLMSTVKVLANEIESAVVSIKTSPGDLLFKQSEEKLGPGEQRQ